VLEALLSEPCTDPPESMLVVGRKGIDAMALVAEGIEVSKLGRTYIVPLANVRHMRVA
jgi:hypothetical protein